MNSLILSGLVVAQLASAVVIAQEVPSDTARTAKRLVTTCRACHSLDKDGSQSDAPTLHALFGRRAGSNEGFDYSEAVKSSSIIWSEQTLDFFLKNPQVSIPGNKMAYIGIPDDAERKILIGYLKQQTSTP